MNLFSNPAKENNSYLQMKHSRLDDLSASSDIEQEIQHR